MSCTRTTRTQFYSSRIVARAQGSDLEPSTYGFLYCGLTGKRFSQRQILSDHTDVGRSDDKAAARQRIPEHGGFVDGKKEVS